jgi:hypothetical protein
MTTELIKIDPGAYGLQATEAAQVEAAFLPMIDKMKELESQFNEIALLPIEPTTSKKAKELRLQYVKIRTGTAAIHKTAKEYYRNGGLFVDGWKNAQAFASQQKEQKLEQIELHFENLEKERKEKLKIERLALLAGLCDDPSMYPVSDMSTPAFEQLLNGLTVAKQQREDAIRQAEENRLAKEKADREEQERIRLENERLKKEAEAAEVERKKQEALRNAEIAKAAKEKAELEEAARQERLKAQALAEVERKKQEAARKAIEEKARKEREAAQAKAAKEKADADAKLAAEKEAARIAAEKAAKEKAELEKKLADLIKCPKCSHEFSIKETKGK